MPRIQQEYLDCSIYLYDSKLSAEAGENSGGSGCLVSVESNPIFDLDSYKDGKYTRIKHAFPPHLYAVTNKHVIQQGCSVIRLNTIDDEIDVIELDPHEWTSHPNGDDLAIAPVELPENRHRYHPISTSRFLHRDGLDDVGAGDDVFMVGRFTSHAGSQRNTPSLRFGSIAMLPFEKIKLAPTLKSHMQEAFLIEMRSISGYSGSPVFVYRPEMKTEYQRRSDYNLMPKPSYDDFLASWGQSKSMIGLVGDPTLLGIDCGHVRRYDKVENGIGTPHPQGWRVAGNTGMAIVIPAWRLEDFLNEPEQAEMRIKKDQLYIKEKEAEDGVAMDAAAPQRFFDKNYLNSLKRAGRKVSESKAQKKDSDSTLV